MVLFGIILVCFAVITFLWIDFDFNYENKINSEKFGQFGDFLGGVVGSLWALAGVLLFYKALSEQREDIKTNKQALKLQVEALNQQVEQFKIQTGELESSRKVYEQQLNGNKNTLNLQKQAAGMYTLKIQVGAQNYYTKVIISQ